jgi:hypothetical protein
MGTGINFLSWNGDEENNVLPRRPSTNDMGGDDLENDELAPPGPGDPDATAWDAKVREIAAVAKTASAAKVTVTFSGGAPQWELFAAPGSVTTDDLDLVDAGTGVTEITWPANTFPPASVWPHGLTFHADVVGYAEPITNGVRILSYGRESGDPANGDFTICIG